MQSAETNRVQIPAQIPAQIEGFRYPESPFHVRAGLFPESAFNPDSGYPDSAHATSVEASVQASVHASVNPLLGANEVAPGAIPGDGAHMESFGYPAVSSTAPPRGGGLYGAIEGLAAEVGDAGFSSRVDRSWDEGPLKQVLAEETRKAEERGRILGLDQGMIRGREEGLEQGMHQGREQGRVRVLEEGSREIDEERRRLHSQAASLLESFASAKEHYLHQLEVESVQLALAIAARILRREAQADPLLLTGSVRVALGQFAASTKVSLWVPAADQPLWQEALARIPGLSLRPQVLADPQMELGECRMETELGTADLGLWAQLKSIEKGFFERAGMHPPSEIKPPATTASSPQPAVSYAEGADDGH